MVSLIHRKEQKIKPEKLPRVSGDKRIDPTPEQAAQFETAYTECLGDPDLLLVVIGTDEEKEHHIQTVRTWGTYRKAGRVTLRIYNHPNPEPLATYFRLMPFIRGT